jgi:hypothetical protein
MRTVFASFSLLALGAALVAGSGCKNTCSSNDQGSQCTSKSVTEFRGTAVDKDIGYSAGQNLSIDTVYGNVTVVGGGTSGNIHVTFQPFDYEGYDEESLAQNNMNSGLDLGVDGTTDVKVTAARNSSVSTNGLGSGITVTIPNDFNGTITVHNHGSGPLANQDKQFDVNVSAVGAATAVTVVNDSDLGDTFVTGNTGVTNTSVTAHEVVTVTGVADTVNITTDGTGLGDPGVVLSIASISPNAAGGTITSQEGGIQATFPATGDYAIQASAPQGKVNEGTPPGSCNVQTAADTAKTVTCGASGPIYKLTTNGVNDDVFQEGNIDLTYQ